MFLSCHVRVSEWIHTLSLPECQGTPCSKQARNLKVKVTATGFEPRTTYFVNEHSTIWPNWPYAFQSESTLYCCLNVKEFLARSRREISRLSDCNWIRTQNQLVRKRTLNHLASFAKWLSVRLRTKWFWARIQLQSLNLYITF